MSFPLLIILCTSRSHYLLCSLEVYSVTEATMRTCALEVTGILELQNTLQQNHYCADSDGRGATGAEYTAAHECG